MSTSWSFRLCSNIYLAEPEFEQRVDEFNSMGRDVDDFFIHERLFDTIHVPRRAKPIRSQCLGGTEVSDIVAQRLQEIDLWICQRIDFPFKENLVLSQQRIDRSLKLFFRALVLRGAPDGVGKLLHKVGMVLHLPCNSEGEVISDGFARLPESRC